METSNETLGDAKYYDNKKKKLNCIQIWTDQGEHNVCRYTLLLRKGLLVTKI